MRDLQDDPFYELLRSYPRCVVDVLLLEDDASYRGLQSHREVLLFAMLKLIERDLAERHADEVKWGEGSAGEIFPWSLDIGKAQAVSIDPASLLFVPEILRVDRNGTVFYNCDWEPNDTNCGGQIPYWYAFLEPPHGADCKPEDLRRLNAALFPGGAEALEAYAWTTDWSNYFDAGHEWWGAACWTVYDRDRDRFAVLLASATD